MSLYADLGLEPNASPEAIEAAWRNAAKQHHPDAGGDREAFERASRAISILRDPERRERYDRTGDDGTEPDRSQSVIVEILIKAFEEALSQTSQPNQSDVAAMMRHAIQQQMEHLKVQRSQIKAALQQVQNARTRIHVKRGQTNFIANMLDARALAHERQIEDVDRLEGLARQAFSLAENYSWQIDEAPHQQGFMIFTSSTATGTV